MAPRNRTPLVAATTDTHVPFRYPPVAESPLVLCIDDDPAILELLEDIFTACGIRAVCTSDCSTALRIATSEPLDAIVLDYHMPELDGLTLAQQIRQHKSHVPMILFSSAQLPSDALDVVSRIVPKGDGALTLADAVFESIEGPTHAA
ncbi:MAG TPA: response regulator [Candidatus Koribacter sp.]